MVAKISHSLSLYGIINYNQEKVLEKNAEVIFTNEMIYQDYSISKTVDVLTSFEPYLFANKRTKKTAVHISINPDPKDNITNETVIDIIKDYMEGLGYKDQPYIVYEHKDIDRKHYHVVTTCVDKRGNKIDDSFEGKRLWKLSREIENKYYLIPYNKRERLSGKNLHKVDHTKGNTTEQVREVAGMVIENFKFQSINELASFLKAYNILLSYEKINQNGKKRVAVSYQCLNDKGEKVSKPFFSSSLGKKFTYSFIEKACRSNKQAITPKTKEYIKGKIEKAKLRCKERTPQELKKQLNSLKMDILYHRNKEGDLYGITFIDYSSSTIINGSGLGKEFSANEINAFLDGSVIYHAKEEKPEVQTDFSHGLILPHSDAPDKDEEAFKRKLRKKNTPKL